MNLVVEDYEVIKHIGKGSFSNVYLCKNEMPVYISESESHDELFIIKEININELVKSYILKNSGSTIRRVGKGKRKDGDENVAVNITPYENSDELTNLEQEYYFHRLEELIESEIEILSNLDHPNVIKFYGHTKKNGIYYLRMEYCNGGDVYDFLKSDKSEKYRNSSGGFTNTFFYEFFAQITHGLKYVHDKNMIHRDIKLHNVLLKYVDNTIQFKLSDFGFTCYDLTSMNIKDVDLDVVLCKKYYKLCGTPYYMAPEIILNMNMMENIANYKSRNKRLPFVYSKKIDIWSFGICVYELMFNLLPFSNIKNINDLERFYKLENIQGIMDKKIHRRITLKPEFKNLIMSMIRVDKNERCSVDDIVKFLTECEDITDLIQNENHSANVLDMINCRENSFIKNEQMKQHVVRNPVIPETQEIEENLNLSWEKINKSSSLIMKTSVQPGFLNWLFNKK
jgi:serine/threonine protein kinase